MAIVPERTTKMKRHPVLSAALLLVLLATFAAAAQAAGAPSPTPAVVAPAAPAAVAPLATTQPPWDPAILSGLAPQATPMSANDNPLAQIAQPAFCPPPCLGCRPPLRCTGPCQVNMGCTICRCST